MSGVIGWKLEWSVKKWEDGKEMEIRYLVYFFEKFVWDKIDIG